MERLLSNPEAIDLAYATQTKYTFPALTFCPVRHGKKIKDLKRNPNEPGPWPYDLEAWRDCNNTVDQLGIFMNFPGDDEQCMRKNLYKRALNKWDDFHLKDVDIRTWSGDPFDKNNFENSVYMTEWKQINHGICYTMNFKQHILDQGVWFMKITHDVADLKYILTIHTPRALQDPSNSLGGMSLAINPLTINDFAIDYESVTLLHYDGIPCNPDPEYNLDQCALNRIDRHLMNTIGCATPLGNYTDSDTACANKDDAETAQLFYFENQLETSEECPYPCNTLWNKVTASDTKPTGNLGGAPSLQVFLSFPKFVKGSQARYVYQIINFIGEFGGVIGLFLGVSIMQLTDLMIWLSREVIHWANKNRGIDFRKGKGGSAKMGNKTYGGGSGILSSTLTKIQEDY